MAKLYPQKGKLIKTGPLSKRENRPVPTSESSRKNKIASRNSDLTKVSRDKSGGRKSKIKKNHKIINRGWTKSSHSNKQGDSETMYQQLASDSRRLIMQTQIPLITRQIASNTAYPSTKNSRIENNKTPKNGEIAISARNRIQNKSKTKFFNHNGLKLQSHFASNTLYEDNLKRANSEIDLLKQELQQKNKELLKLKSTDKFSDKCKTPHTNSDMISPNKLNLSRRMKLKSRVKTGQPKVEIPEDLDLNNSNSHSDEYYETTKISPTSSITNSAYSKGIPHIKSSQSCRNIKEDSTPAIANNDL